MRGHFAGTAGNAPAHSDCAGCGFAAWLQPAGLRPEQLALIERITLHRCTVRRNQYLVHAGDALQSLYIVNSGSVKTSMPDQDGREQLVGFALPGEVVGIEAIATGRYPDSIVALEDTSCCGVHFVDLLRLSAHMPRLQRHIFLTMSSEIAHNHELILMLGGMRAEKRFAAFLVNLLNRHAARGYSARRIRLSMTRQDIGNYLGLQLETVSRLLTYFRNERILDVNGREITLRDIDRLRRVCDGTYGRIPWARTHAASARQ